LFIIIVTFDRKQLHHKTVYSLDQQRNTARFKITKRKRNNGGSSFLYYLRFAQFPRQDYTSSINMWWEVSLESNGSFVAAAAAAQLPDLSTFPPPLQTLFQVCPNLYFPGFVLSDAMVARAQLDCQAVLAALAEARGGRRHNLANPERWTRSDGLFGLVRGAQIRLFHLEKAKLETDHGGPLTAAEDLVLWQKTASLYDMPPPSIFHPVIGALLSRYPKLWTPGWSLESAIGEKKEAVTEADAQISDELSLRRGDRRWEVARFEKERRQLIWLVCAKKEIELERSLTNEEMLVVWEENGGEKRRFLDFPFTSEEARVAAKEFLASK
jgi:hypothetical protein